MNPSASKLDMVEQCTGSLFMPNFESSGLDAIRGTLTHKYMELRGLGRDADACDLMAANKQYHEYWSNIPHADILGLFKEFHPESQFWWDPKTGRCGAGTERNNPGYVWGQCDGWGYLHDGRLVVIDYKTGRELNGSAKDKMQLRFFSMVLAKMLGPNDPVQAIYIYLPEKQITETGEYTMYPTEFDAFDNAETEQRLYKIIDNARINADAEMPRLVAGEHCKYCNSYSICPNTTTLIRQLAGINEDDNEMPDFQNLANSWNMMRRAKMLFEKSDEAIKNYVKSMGGFDLDDKWVVQQTRRGIMATRKK
jgi:CRISPR/Cas system-associated exonuclease Cas4 (RecB family)